MANVQIKQEVKQEKVDVEIKKRDSEEEQNPENESDRQTGETIGVVLPRWIALKEAKSESVAENPTEKIAIPALATTAYTAKQPKKRKTDSSKRETKRECDRKRSKSRIYIGEAFQRWRELRDCVGFTLDSELALLLLDIYDRYAQGASVSTPVSRPKSERDGFSEGCQEADVKQESFVSVVADDDSEHTEDSAEDQINGFMNSFPDWKNQSSHEPDGPAPVCEEEGDRSDEDDFSPLCARCRRPWSEKAQRRSACSSKSQKEHGYIPDVQRVTGGVRLTSDRGSQRRRKRPEDPEKPRLIPPVSSEEGLDQT